MKIIPQSENPRKWHYPEVLCKERDAIKNQNFKIKIKKLKN
jgi:hypothetical protein